jgi:hypothetical protein
VRTDACGKASESGREVLVFDLTLNELPVSNRIYISLPSLRKQVEGVIAYEIAYEITYGWGDCDPLGAGLMEFPGAQLRKVRVCCVSRRGLAPFIMPETAEGGVQ